MGCRAIVVFKDSLGISPAVYLHWDGERVPELLEQNKILMRGRQDDAQYACARFIGICHNHIEGNLSLGVSNMSDSNLKEFKENPSNISPGDEGVFAVDTTHNFRVERFK
jgi:hypothetical protein